MTIEKAPIRRRHPANTGRCKATTYANRARTGTRYRCHLREDHQQHAGRMFHMAPRGRETVRWLA